MAEVDEQAQPIPGRFEVIVNLRAMFVGEFFHRFQFNDDFAVADQVRHILRFERTPLVAESEFLFGHERNAAALLVACTVANVALTAFLARWFGLTGAAVATTATLIAWNLGMMHYIWRRLQILPGLLGSVRTFKNARSKTETTYVRAKKPAKTFPITFV